MSNLGQLLRVFTSNPERKKYEKQFLDHLNAQARILQRPMGFLAIVVWLGYAFDTDPKLHPEFPELFYFRMSFSLSGVVVFAVSFFDKLRGKGLGWLYVIASFLLFTCAFFTGRLADDPAYMAGFQLIILVGALIPFPFRAFFVFYTVSLVLFISAILIYKPVILSESVKYSMNNLAIGYIMAYLMTLLLDRFRFALFRKNLKLQDARDALWGEMQIAKKIQTMLLPKKPSIEGFDISTHMAPADEVGGDYYDIIHASGKDWIVIGDVSGHGVPAGLIMMMVQTSVNVVIDHNPGLEPSEILRVVNKTISKNVRKLNEERYMTITVLACKEGGNLYFSGLHQDIMIYRKQTDQVDLLETNGMWIGIVDDISGMLSDGAFHLDMGDTLLLYTDGITEARLKSVSRRERSSEDELYGSARLWETFRSLGNRSPEEIRLGILRSLKDYTCDDDVTLVILKKTA